MSACNILIEVARQHGFRTEMACVALDFTATRLRERGQAARSHFYIYRTESKHVGAGRAGERLRVIPAFAMPDSALSFVQRSQLGSVPRLSRMSVAQLLAAMVQRPTIGALLFVDEPITIVPKHSLPAGLRLERAILLEILKGEEIHYG